MSLYRYSLLLKSYHAGWWPGNAWHNIGHTFFFFARNILGLARVRRYCQVIQGHDHARCWIIDPKGCHCIEITWATWRIKSLANQLFLQEEWLPMNCRQDICHHIKCVPLWMSFKQHFIMTYHIRQQVLKYIKSKKSVIQNVFIHVHF